MAYPALNPRTIRLRPESADDTPFLLQLYAQTLGAEWGVQEGKALDPLIELQFRCREAGYRTDFRGAEFRIILSNSRPIGRLVVHRSAREMRLVDLALLSECRGQAIGAKLILTLQEEARRDGRLLRLEVIPGSRAVGLYRRLGFHPSGQAGVHLVLKWNP